MGLAPKYSQLCCGLVFPTSVTFRCGSTFCIPRHVPPFQRGYVRTFKPGALVDLDYVHMLIADFTNHNCHYCSTMNGSKPLSAIAITIANGMLDHPPTRTRILVISCYHQPISNPLGSYKLGHRRAVFCGQSMHISEGTCTWLSLLVLTVKHEVTILTRPT